MVNPDGVYVGNSRADFEGNDPNRDWDNNDTVEINMVRNSLESINNEYGIDMFVDWHSQMDDDSWFNYVYSPPGNGFFDILSKWTDFDDQYAVGTSCRRDSCTARGYATLRLGLFTFVFEPTPHLTSWTEESLKQQGKYTAFSIDEYFGMCRFVYLPLMYHP
jgi:hypothetical protein